MGITLAVHIVAGALGLVSGYIALYAPKGGTVHRRSGMVFVYAMLTMTLIGFVLAAVRNAAPALNIPAAVITFYLVLTGLTTLRPPATGARSLHIGAMLVALAVGGIALTLGIQAVANGGKRHGMPAFPFFLFGIIGILATIGDLRVLRSGLLEGRRRISRHLWRMTFALFIAAMSFFFGQAKVIPKPIRIYPLLAMPVLAVLVTMLYWMWRVRTKGTHRRIVTTPESTSGSPLLGRTSGRTS